MHALLGGRCVSTGSYGGAYLPRPIAFARTHFPGLPSLPMKGQALSSAELHRCLF
jgi:hypothetical protein